MKDLIPRVWDVVAVERRAACWRLEICVVFPTLEQGGVTSQLVLRRDGAAETPVG